jgi:7,8-dihydro-6-hydroxymethylpterin-pyrophosphokinase
MTEETLVVLGLGCNVGNRHKTLTAAILLLNGFLTDIVCSSRYESAALLLPGSPPEWNMPFLNMAVKGTTTQKVTPTPTTKVKATPTGE